MCYYTALAADKFLLGVLVSILQALLRLLVQHSQLVLSEPSQSL